MLFPRLESHSWEDKQFYKKLPVAKQAGNEYISSIVGGSRQEVYQPQHWAVMDATALLKGHLEVGIHFPVVSAIINVKTQELI